MAELRRQHRIVYHTKVRLRAPGRETSVVARVQNLSARGIFVTASDIPDAGTEVQCRLTLAGERRTLRGRVAWVRPASQATPLKSPGAGIEFIHLGDKDADLLSRLVEPVVDGERQPVDVWFEGMKAPVRCQAVVMGEGLRLSTRLPFMRLASSVRVSLTQHGAPDVRIGTLDAVTLEPSTEDGVPHLQLTVSTPLLDSAQGTIRVEEPRRNRTPTEGVLVGGGEPSTVVDMTVVAPPPAAALDADTTAVAPAPVAAPPVVISARTEVSDRDRTQRIQLPNRPASLQAPAPKAPPLRRSWKHDLVAGWRALAVGFGAGALVVALGTVFFRGPAAPTPAPQPPTAVSAVPARPEPPARPVASAGVTIEPLPAGGTSAPTALPAPETAEAPTQAERPVVTAIAPAPPAAPAARVTGGDMPVTIEGDTRSIELSVVGSIKGAQSYRLADPPGIAINLPRARTRLAAGTYRPGEGFRQVWIQRRPVGTHVRFLFDPGQDAGDVDLAGGVVRLVLRKR